MLQHIVPSLRDAGGRLLRTYKDDRAHLNAYECAERYGLLVIIALGEAILGTIADIQGILQKVELAPEIDRADHRAGVDPDPQADDETNHRRQHTEQQGVAHCRLELWPHRPAPLDRASPVERQEMA